MVLKLGKTAVYVALERVLNKASIAANILQQASTIGKLTEESHGNLLEDIESDVAKAVTALKNIRAEMQMPTPRVPGVLLGVHKDEPEKNRFVVLSFVREGDINKMSAEELVATYKDTGAYVKVWFQPTVIPESV